MCYGALASTVTPYRNTYLYGREGGRGGGGRGEQSLELLNKTLQIWFLPGSSSQHNSGAFLAHQSQQDWVQCLGSGSPGETDELLRQTLPSQTGFACLISNRSRPRGKQFCQTPQGWNPLISVLSTHPIVLGMDWSPGASEMPYSQT